MARQHVEERASAREVLVYERVLPAVQSSIERIRHELDAALAHLAVDQERREEVALFVTEAATNAVLHAYVDMDPGSVDVSAVVERDNLLITVSDCGRGMRPHADSPGLGIGLQLMSGLCDDLDVASPPFATGTVISGLFEHTTPTMTAPARSEVVGDVVRGRDDAESIRIYVEALIESSAALHDDSRAVLAQARQAVTRAQRLRQERTRGISQPAPQEL